MLYVQDLPWINAVNHLGVAEKTSAFKILSSPPSAYTTLCGSVTQQAAAINFLVATAQDTDWGKQDKWSPKSWAKYELSSFAQDKRLIDPKKLQPVGQLYWFLPSGTQISWAGIFQNDKGRVGHLFTDDKYVMCAGCILNAFAEHALFSRGGGQGYGLAINNKEKCGSAVHALYAFAWGATVADTIKLNIHDYSRASWGYTEGPCSMTLNQMYSSIPRRFNVVWKAPTSRCVLCDDEKLPHASHVYIHGLTFNDITCVDDPRLLIGDDEKKKNKTKRMGAYTPADKLAKVALAKFSGDFRIFGMKTHQSEKVVGFTYMDRDLAESVLTPTSKKTIIASVADDHQIQERAKKAVRILRGYSEKTLASIRAAYIKGIVNDTEISLLRESYWRSALSPSRSTTKHAAYAVFVGFAYNPRCGFQKPSVQRIRQAAWSPNGLANLCPRPDWAYILSVLLQESSNG